MCVVAIRVQTYGNRRLKCQMMENKWQTNLSQKTKYCGVSFFYKMPFRPIVLKARKTNQKVINSSSFIGPYVLILSTTFLHIENICKFWKHCYDGSL